MSSQQCRNFYVEVNVIHKYMTGRAIRGNILFDAGSICPTEERDDIEADVLPNCRNCNNRFITLLTSCPSDQYFMGH